MTCVFAIQHKTTKCYFLFNSTEDNCDKEASTIISSKVNKFFELCPDIDTYKIGDVDFDVSIFDELNNKSGEQYEDIKDDDFCMNTNIDKCLEILNKKLSVKPRAKKAAKIVTKEEPKKEEIKQEEKKEEKPKPRGKRSAQIKNIENVN